MPEKDSSTREEFWRKAIARQQASGLSQVKFCEQEGLGANSFSAWKTTINRQDAEKEQEVKRALRQASVNKAARVAETASFIPLVPAGESTKIAPAPAADHCVAEIILSCGTIRINSGADSKTLGALLKALKETVLC